MTQKVNGTTVDLPVVPTVPSFLYGSVASVGATIAAGSSTTRTVSVAGAVLGNYAVGSLTVNSGALTISASVTAADTVTVVLANNTASPITIAVGTCKAVVMKPA